MGNKEENKKSPKGFMSKIWESMTKTSEGCGPGCSCHVEKPKEKPKDGEDIRKDGKK